MQMSARQPADRQPADRQPADRPVLFSEPPSAPLGENRSTMEAASAPSSALPTLSEEPSTDLSAPQGLYRGPNGCHRLNSTSATSREPPSLCIMKEPPSLGTTNEPAAPLGPGRSSGTAESASPGFPLDVELGGAEPPLASDGQLTDPSPSINNPPSMWSRVRASRLASASSFPTARVTIPTAADSSKAGAVAEWIQKPSSYVAASFPSRDYKDDPKEGLDDPAVLGTTHQPPSSDLTGPAAKRSPSPVSKSTLAAADIHHDQNRSVLRSMAFGR